MNLKELKGTILAELRRKGKLGLYDPYEITLFINRAKDQLAEDVGGFPGVAVRNSLATVERYKLPDELIKLRRVEFDSEVIDRIYSDAIKQLDIDAIIANGGFETLGLGGTAEVFDNWTVGGTDTSLVTYNTTYVNSNSGSIFSAQLSSSEAGYYCSIYQDFDVIPGAYYTMTVWSCGDGTTRPRYNFYDVTNSTNITSIAVLGAVTAVMAKVTLSFRSPANCIKARVYFYSATPSTSDYDGFIDDVEIIRQVGNWQITNKTGY